MSDILTPEEFESRLRLAWHTEDYTGESHQGLLAHDAALRAQLAAEQLEVDWQGERRRDAEAALAAERTRREDAEQTLAATRHSLVVATEYGDRWLVRMEEAEAQVAAWFAASERLRLHGDHSAINALRQNLPIEATRLRELAVLAEREVVRTKDEYDVLSRFLWHLTSETSWLNSKWVEGAGVHEMSVLTTIAKRLDVARGVTP